MNTVAAIVQCSTVTPEFKHYLSIASLAQVEDAIAQTKARGKEDAPEDSRGAQGSAMSHVSTQTREPKDAAIRTKVATAQAKQDGRTFMLLFADDAHELLKRLQVRECDCDKELLS